ncbi:hypothetical protein L2747_18810 [Shewanella marinintestina]|uniref:hypothetical protein n=1 Tax=Shewanella marinintestina TaxID=190305 RepID=UPI00200FDC37|nr:hypothetical protein [Shewanella marinintestina]MCL1148058.1 hypothetical protein [Shewanella marinintestina]
MKPTHLKKTIDFVQQHSKQSAKQLRHLLKTNPQAFLELLHQTCASVKSIPTSVNLFINYFEQESTMKNQESVSLGMKIVLTFKKVVSSVTQFFSTKKQQVKVIVAAAAVAGAAYVATGGSIVVASVAAIKGQGVIGAVIQGAKKVKEVLMMAREVVIEKASLLLVALNGFGCIAMAKLIEAKNYVVKKAKQLLIWGKGLFVFEPQVDIAA